MGSEVRGTAEGGTPSPYGAQGVPSPRGQSRPPLTPMTPEPMEAEMKMTDVVIVQGNTIEERVAS